MPSPLYPSLYQINTRVWLTELSRKLGRPATLDDVSFRDIDGWAQMGFDWIWLLSVWTTGPAARKVSRSQGEWRKEFKETLPDLKDEDIEGSGFSIARYAVSPALGGDAALARLRKKLREHGLKLMLDFVPNHMGIDHPWVQTHHDRFVSGTEDDLAREPKNYVRIPGDRGAMILAHGRDPNFPGWPDTLQLDYSNPATQEAMTQELVKVAEQCDGVRCDMAMLLLPAVFERTWGRMAEFWPQAITRVRQRVPAFTFMAEVYWDLEWTIQQSGFDYAYDKRMYDRLRDGDARPVRDHLYAEIGYQNKLARFLENHDEPRAAATFEPKKHRAAAVLTFLSPGLRFFHQGELEGRKVRISPHLVRGPQERADEELRTFYENLLQVLRDPAVRDGQWRLLECVPAWEGNGSWDAFIAFGWQTAGARLLVCVNYSPHQSQCYVRLPLAGWEGRSILFKDLMGPARYDRTVADVSSRGLYLDLPPWASHVFACIPTDKVPR